MNRPQSHWVQTIGEGPEVPAAASARPPGSSQSAALADTSPNQIQTQHCQQQQDKQFHLEPCSPADLQTHETHVLVLLVFSANPGHLCAATTLPSTSQGKLHHVKVAVGKPSRALSPMP
mmetsp:Transcript_89645/g.187246  ORF Transcript_89645/g.187246 Transcript_89645/m.187246 type:complete len:119 (-) Transcript_89645:435-791(-)